MRGYDFIIISEIIRNIRLELKKAKMELNVREKKAWKYFPSWLPFSELYDFQENKKKTLMILVFICTKLVGNIVE